MTIHAIISSLQLGNMIHHLENALIDSLQTTQADLIKIGTTNIILMGSQYFRQLTYPTFMSFFFW
jgi:hypothetical protein